MAKKYNHRRAEEEFKKMKKKDEKFMRENGMPETKILIMRAFDRTSFNSDRRFYERVDFDSEKIIAAARQPEEHSLSEPKNVKDFIDSLVSIALVDSLKAFGFETQIIAFFIEDTRQKRFLHLQVFLNGQFPEEFQNWLKHINASNLIHNLQSGTNIDSASFKISTLNT